MFGDKTEEPSLADLSKSQWLQGKPLYFPGVSWGFSGNSQRRKTWWWWNRNIFSLRSFCYSLPALVQVFPGFLRDDYLMMSLPTMFPTALSTQAEKWTLLFPFHSDHLWFLSPSDCQRSVFISVFWWLLGMFLWPWTWWYYRSILAIPGWAVYHRQCERWAVSRTWGRKWLGAISVQC